MKTKRESRLVLQSWDEADGALFAIGKIDREIAREENVLNGQISRLKEESKARVAPLAAEKKAKEKDLEAFCKARRADLAGRQSRRLTFGTVSFRRSSKLVVHSVSNTIAAIRRVFGLEEGGRYLVVKESLNKEALERLSEKDLSAIGVTPKETESFGYEIDWQSLER